jgi:hypothetical protein
MEETTMNDEDRARSTVRRLYYDGLIGLAMSQCNFIDKVLIQVFKELRAEIEEGKRIEQLASKN